MEDMEFRYKLGQRSPRWRIIFAWICWIRRKHFWKYVQLTNVEMKNGEKFKWIDTARCKLCRVFYHSWW